MVARRDAAKHRRYSRLDQPKASATPLENKRKNRVSSKAKSSILSRYMNPAHLRVTRMLGYCLTLGTADAWLDFGFVASVRLSATERASLAFAALASLDPEDARTAAAAALGAAGEPLPPFLGAMDEARDWAAWATPAELDAYCLAAFQRMAPDRQAAFLRFVQGRAAA